MPIDQACVIGLQVASALDAAHRNGLIHRDVKPGNILIEPGPDPDSAPIAYLADLGLTKHVDSHSGVTGSGELLGTIDYIAPEQIDGSRVDGRADIYSLACVLFECLTGSVPYLRENQAAVLWAHLHDDVPKASSVNPTLTPAVDAALARGMAKSPDDRFPTGRELVAVSPVAARSIDHGQPERCATRSMPSAPPTSPAAPRRRGNRAVVLAALAGLLLGGAAAVGVALLVLDDETPAPAAADGQTTSENPPASEATTTGETTTANGTTQSPSVAASDSVLKASSAPRRAHTRSRAARSGRRRVAARDRAEQAARVVLLRLRRGSARRSPARRPRRPSSPALRRP